MEDYYDDYHLERPGEEAYSAVWADYIHCLVHATCPSDAELPPQPAEVAPGVFLGGIWEARDLNALHSRQIDCVLNMASGSADCGPSALRGYPSLFAVLDLDAEDSMSYDMFANDVPEALEFLEWCSSKGRNVLVHCFAGMNRSATVCTAWIVRTQKCPLDAAVKHLAMQRGYVLGNTRFICGLVDMTRAMGCFLSSSSARRRQQRKDHRLADAAEAQEKAERDAQVAEGEKIRKEQARTLKDLKRQLADLEGIVQQDADWEHMTDEDSERLDLLADLRERIAGLEHSKSSLSEDTRVR